jgi:SAM-dependent methyltransferase
MNDLAVAVKLFWDKCHSTDKIDSLSGCQYHETISFLKLQSYIKPSIHVLEIGVGLGYVTKGLYDAGTVVSCLEVSDVGIERVKEYCESFYTVDNLESLPSNYFDVIVCNNVIQHVPTNVLIEELKHCIRSLNSTGVFAVEFVSNDEVEDMGINPSFEMIKGGSCCRTPQFLEELIGQIGGKCTLVFSNVVDFGDVKGQHVFHVVK